ncbi:uncharacterized protein TNIN_373821 [Trichonephila inaurata madagascariensis]|uniref:Uncharacterized protein n=1 Tax=Trichonephila inaurata madagascariensis TaxID=2747483 RepID=A0A8X6IRV5_9ARAC|nr:uncharacterized protein TNIN_373821 [Trichonephila inaurata madagascariensis]
MAYLGKGRIAELRYIAKQLGEKVTNDLKIIDLKNLIVNSPNYEEEFVREMLNMIIEKRLKTSTSRVSKYFDLNERYILSTYELETLFKLKKHNSKTLDKVKSKSESVSLNPCIIKSKKNEVEMPVLKDTEASLDLSFEKYAAPEIFTEKKSGEWKRQGQNKIHVGAIYDLGEQVELSPDHPENRIKAKGDQSGPKEEINSTDPTIKSKEASSTQQARVVRRPREDGQAVRI